MFISAVLAGNVFPFSSEIVILGLLAAGGDATTLIITATAGNVAGAMINYYIGTLGKEEWIVKYLHLSPEKQAKGRRIVDRYGFWAGLLAWIPFLGSLTTVSMGYLRTNLPLSLLSITLGKYVRYQIIVSAWLAANA